MGCFAPDPPDPPPPRDVGKETRDTLQAQVDLAPDVYQSESTYRPKYAALDMSILHDTLKGTDGQKGLIDLFKEDLVPEMRALALQEAIDNRDAQRLQREADIADVEALGKRATDAIEGANPQLKQLTDMLADQAARDLALEKSLSPEEMRDVTQATRTAFSDRGLMHSNPAIFAEALNRDKYGVERQGQRREFAGNVANLLKTTQSDPFLAVLSRPAAPLSTNAMAQNQFGNAGFSLNSSNKMFGTNQAQMNAWGQDVADSNFNAAWSDYIGKQNAAAASAFNPFALVGPVLGFGGQIGSAMIT